MKNKAAERIAKANPTPGDVHVSQPLTNISVAYIQDSSNFIADKVFPQVPVQKQSDLYYIFSKDDFLRDEAQYRAPATESAGGGFQLTTDFYGCKVEAFHKDVDDQMRANADSVLSLDSAATEFVTQKLMIRREKGWMTKFFGTGIWTTDITPGILWDAANSTPRKDVDTGKKTVKGTTGLEPNTLVVQDGVFYALRNNADIRDQFKYTSADSIDEAMMARYFGIARFIRASAIVNTANEGATGATSYMAGKHALLCYSAPSPSLMQPTAGYTFVWTGLVGSVQGVRIKRFRMEHLEADRIEGQIATAQKQVSADLGYFFNGVIS